MYKINFNHLYYFLTISKEGTIVKAAKKLNMTQPALSHQLKLLEQDLGKKLFDRVGRRLVINNDGESVKEYATKIFRQSEDMLQVLKSENVSVIKILKIGTVSWISPEQVYDFIKPLTASPHIKVEVYQRDLETLIKDVANNRLDIILCDSPYSGRSKKLQGHRLTLDPIYCVASPKKFHKGKFPQSIDGKKVLSYTENSMIADKIDDFLSKNNLNVEVVGTFTDSTLIKTATEMGAGISFLPKSSVQKSIKSKNLIKLGEVQNLKFSFWAITRKDYKKDGLISLTINNFLNTK